MNSKNRAFNYEAIANATRREMFQLAGEGMAAAVFSAATGNVLAQEPAARQPAAQNTSGNIPFSLISLHNKDLDQQWVIAWTWNKWRHADGSKDSMLYCDNFRLKDGKIVYLNSLQNQPSKSLSKTLNGITEK